MMAPFHLSSHDYSCIKHQGEIINLCFDQLYSFSFCKKYDPYKLQQWHMKSSRKLTSCLYIVVDTSVYFMLAIKLAVHIKSCWMFVCQNTGENTLQSVHVGRETSPFQLNACVTLRHPLANISDYFCWLFSLVRHELKLVGHRTFSKQ